MLILKHVFFRLNAIFGTRWLRQKLDFEIKGHLLQINHDNNRVLSCYMHGFLNTLVSYGSNGVKVLRCQKVGDCFDYNSFKHVNRIVDTTHCFKHSSSYIDTS